MAGLQLLFVFTDCMPASTLASNASSQLQLLYPSYKNRVESACVSSEILLLSSKYIQCILGYPKFDYLVFELTKACY